MTTIGWGVAVIADGEQIDPNDVLYPPCVLYRSAERAKRRAFQQEADFIHFNLDERDPDPVPAWEAAPYKGDGPYSFTWHNSDTARTYHVYAVSMESKEFPP